MLATHGIGRHMMEDTLLQLHDCHVPVQLCTYKALVCHRLCAPQIVAPVVFPVCPPVSSNCCVTVL